ncbi:MAG: RNA polymerase sigma factor [Myxococcales bacterium]|nr:RNA polymerase sigma factor [Myxococcales bacterium]
MQDDLQAAMPRAYIAAVRWLGNPDESRDACQEAAVKAWASRSQFDAKRPFYPWFYRIVRNVCFDRLRVRPRQVTMTTDVVARDDSAEDGLIAGQRRAAVQRAMAQLPEPTREILELRHFQDLSYDEIAEVLGCPNGTVMSRLYRARKALAQKLERDPAVRKDGGGR